MARQPHGSPESEYAFAHTDQGATIRTPDVSKKLVIVGDGGCGKTCLLFVYSREEFPEVLFVCLTRKWEAESGCRITCLLFSKLMLFSELLCRPDRRSAEAEYRIPQEGKLIELTLWDTAGQEEYVRLSLLQSVNQADCKDRID